MTDAEWAALQFLLPAVGRTGRMRRIDLRVMNALRYLARSGYDANKKVVGRKRHIAVDSDGCLLRGNLTPADIADGTGAIAVLDVLK